MTDTKAAEMTDFALSNDMAEIIAATGQAKPEDQGPFPAGGDIHYVTDDLQKWKSLANFLVPYIEVQPWKDVEKRRPIFDDAVAKATEWFRERGALEPIRFPDNAIEVHLHPLSHQVVFFFKRVIGGSGEKECGIPYMLSNDQVGWLKATNRWPKEADRVTH